MTEKDLANELEMGEMIDRLAQNVIDENDLNEMVLVGIRSRGVPLAEWLAQSIEKIKSVKVPVGSLDINLYRDDLSEVNEQPLVQKTELPFKITGRGIILVDDVLYTGRTIRAAMDELIDFGRPRFIRLLVMVDRGWRELPIEASYIGMKIETSLEENIKVMVRPIDPENKILKRSNGS
ncbi:MAG: bifunctional pyr operon transcriptional regulator/uracil phosphoribosyltransferase PyrR [Pseudomonadota bacterium]